MSIPEKNPEKVSQDSGANSRAVRAASRRKNHPKRVVSESGAPLASVLIHVRKSVIPAPSVVTSINSAPDPQHERRCQRYSELKRGDLEFFKWLAQAQPSWGLFDDKGNELPAIGSEASKRLVLETVRKRARKGRECGSFLLFREYFTHPERPRKLSGGNFCCQTHFCTLCSAFRSARLLADVIPKLQEAHAADKSQRFAMLTITSKDREHLPGMFKEQIGAWNRWLEKRRNALKGQKWSNLAHLRGGAMSFETKRGRGSGLWHFHGHAVVLAPPGLDKFHFVDEWSKLLGYEANLDFRYLKTSQALDEGKTLGECGEDFGKELLEVCKYPLKTTELGWADRWNAAAFLRGKRLFRPFGVLHGLEPSEEFVDDVSSFDALPYLEIVLHWSSGKYRASRAGEGSACPPLSSPNDTRAEGVL